MHSLRHSFPLALLSLLALSSAAAAVENCAVQQLDTPLKWISGVEFNAARSEMLIVDPSSKKLLSLGLGDGKIREVPFTAGLQPTGLTKIQGGFLLKNRDDVAIVGPGLNTIWKSFNLRSSRKGAGSGLSSLYSNWVTRGTAFLGFGSVSNPLSPRGSGAAFDLGFIRGEISATSGEFSKVYLLEASEENDFYLLGVPYFAANDVGMFFVKMTGENATLVRVVDSGKGAYSLQELPVFPTDFRKIPNLKADSGDLGESVAARFRSVERSKMVAGLYGQGRMLYLLTRQLTAVGTEWLLHQIDPERAELRRVLRLPTNAPHLSIGVSPEAWLLLERGEVRAWGDQDIKSIVRVPSIWISSPGSSPLEANKRRTVRCDKFSPPVSAN